jgi:hypothetical protein
MLVGLLSNWLRGQKRSGHGISFTGMNPYLEDPDIWTDFQGTFLVALRAELNKSLPAGYVARLERYVWVDEENEDPRLLGKPDAFIPEATEEEEAVGSAVA